MYLVQKSTNEAPLNNLLFEMDQIRRDGLPASSYRGYLYADRLQVSIVLGGIVSNSQRSVGQQSGLVIQ